MIPSAASPSLSSSLAPGEPSAEPSGSTAQGPRLLRGVKLVAPVRTTSQAVVVVHADLRASVTTTSGAVQILGRSVVRGGAYGEPAVHTDSGDIAVADSTIRGDVRSHTGRIVLDQGTRVDGDVEQLGGGRAPPGPPAIRLSDSTVTGLVQGDRIQMSGARARQVVLDGRRWGEAGGEARIDLYGRNRITSIDAVGPAVVVRHDAASRGVPVSGDDVHVLDLTTPDDLNVLIENTNLPDHAIAFSPLAWRHVQHELERLCALAVDPFPRSVPPADRPRWAAHITEVGHSVARIMLHWMETDPQALMKGLRALDQGALERSCAAIALAVLQRPELEPGSRVTALLREILSLAQTMDIYGGQVRRHLDRLEGSASGGAPLAPSMDPGARRTFDRAGSRQLVASLPAGFREFYELLVYRRRVP